MKKILLFLIMLALPVYAVNWKPVAEKQYIDLDSIEIYGSKYQTQNNEIYSFWIKALNNKSPGFIEMEKVYNKKVWYSLNKYLIDCRDKTIATKSVALYDLDRHPINILEVPNYSIQWDSIVPESAGKSYYYIICSE